MHFPSKGRLMISNVEEPLAGSKLGGAFVDLGGIVLFTTIPPSRVAGRSIKMARPPTREWSIARFCCQQTLHSKGISRRQG